MFPVPSPAATVGGFRQNWRWRGYRRAIGHREALGIRIHCRPRQIPMRTRECVPRLRDVFSNFDSAGATACAQASAGNNNKASGIRKSIRFIATRRSPPAIRRRPAPRWHFDHHRIGPVAPRSAHGRQLTGAAQYQPVLRAGQARYDDPQSSRCFRPLLTSHLQVTARFGQLDRHPRNGVAEHARMPQCDAGHTGVRRKRMRMPIRGVRLALPGCS